MKAFSKSEVERILRHYDAEHDLGPDAPVTWREERLATLLLETVSEIEELKARVATLENPGTPGRDW